jgi:hypothetical protein
MTPSDHYSKLDERRPNLAGVMRPEMLANPLPSRPEPQPPLCCLADLPDQPQEWLWPGRIPCGALTLLCGDQGRGKSLVALDMAARVSAGLPWPHGGAPAEPADVLIFSAEDSLGRTVRGRLLAAGADLERIHYIDTAHWSMETFRPTPQSNYRICSEFGVFSNSIVRSLQRDVSHLRAALEALPDCRLVVLDPFPAYLDKIDVYYDEPEHVREVLSPLVALADLANVAVIAVVHRDGEQRLQSGRKRNGLRTLASMSRAAYIIDRAADGVHRHVMLPVKNNLGDAATAAPFNVVDGPGGMAVIEWSKEPAPMPLDERSNGSTTMTPTRTISAVDRAVQWLTEQLASGPVSSRELTARARMAGFKRSAYERARIRLGVTTTNEGKFGGQWTSALPTSVAPMPRDHKSSDVVETVNIVNTVESQFPEVFPTIDPGESSTIPKTNAA